MHNLIICPSVYAPVSFLRWVFRYEIVRIVRGHAVYLTIDDIWYKLRTRLYDEFAEVVFVRLEMNVREGAYLEIEPVVSQEGCSEKGIDIVSFVKF